MNGKKQGKKKEESSSSSPPRGRPPSPPAYPLEVRRKAVRLRVEEGYPLHLIAGELGVHIESIRHWVQRYQAEGEAGLLPRPSSRRRTPRLPEAVRRQIVETRRAHPGFGIQRIAHLLRRAFLPGSRETVRQTLHREQLLPKPAPKKPPKNPPKPRFFERATPNQLWQSDIFTFRLGGKQAYLIGFLDDHSRYIVGLDLFRSQTSEHVLEVYRTAVGEYGVPKEMLTDNGRQYAAWRGKTRFQMELQKDRVHHLRSQPHHPQTLGKIERFWKTIWEEFLVRAQLENQESARERIRLWVKYYNHQRPHQALDGHCPAERYFAVAGPMKQVLDEGVRENLLEQALRGPPKSPFYLVGRMGGQSVVMKVEEGRFKMLLDGEGDRPVKELNYDLKGSGHEQHNRSEGQERAGAAAGAGEVPGGALGVDGAAATLGDLPGVGGAGEPAVGMAGAGAGGYATGLGTADPASGGPGSDAGAADGETAGAEGGAAGEPVDAAFAAEAALGEAPGELTKAGGGDEQAPCESSGAGDPGSAGGAADRDRGGPLAGDLAQELPPMGGAGPQGTARGAGAAEARPAEEAPGSAEGGARTGEPGAERAVGTAAAAGAYPGVSD